MWIQLILGKLMRADYNSWWGRNIYTRTMMIFMVLLRVYSVAILKCCYNRNSATCTLNSSIASEVLNDMLFFL